MKYTVILLTLFFAAAAFGEPFAHLSDGYEPNNDFPAAYRISPGDSAVKSAFIFGEDSLESDSSKFDVDFYSMTLEAGKLVSIIPFPWDTSCFNRAVRLNFALYDSSKSPVYSDNALTCIDLYTQKRSGYGVPRAGTYYLKIRMVRSNIYQTVQPVKYGLSIRQLDTKGLITLVSPNGGEIFSAQDTVTVKWQGDDDLFDFFVQYSIDSGKSWRDPCPMASQSPPNFSWLVPHLKHRTDRALVRVFADNITNPPFDVSDGPFTILASASDPYEPNDDFASAKAVEVGASAVRNAIVMKSYVGYDSSGTDTSLTDKDFFKVNLTAGSVVTVSDECCELCHLDWNMSVLIRLYDASKNQIAADYRSLSCYIPQSGVYYCEISSMCEVDYWTKYCLSIRQVDGSIAIVSPNGGENLRAGQTVAIHWTADTSLGYITLYYSLNNGASWKRITSVPADNKSFPWTVPALQTQTDRALVKAVVDGVTNPPADVSNGAFTIQAAQSDDPYEPNNEMSSAYPVSLTDSAVKNASLYWYTDTSGVFTGSFGDMDFFMVTLTTQSLFMINQWVSEGGNVGIKLYDTFASVVPAVRNIFETGCYQYMVKPGVYYIKAALAAQKDAWARYGFSTKSMTSLISQRSELDSSAVRFDSSSVEYRGRIIADTTKLALDLISGEKFWASITTMILAQKDLAPLPDEKTKVKAIAVIYNNGYIGFSGMDIASPYALADLNGYPEKRLAVACRNSCSSDRWFSVPCSIDSVKRQIAIHATDLAVVNLFQLYIKSDVGIGSNSGKSPPVFGIRADVPGPKFGVAVHFVLPTATIADLRLYDIRGKCVRKAMFAAASGSSAFGWSLGGLANGKYFLTVKAGASEARKAILIMR